jgi:hypothetical protein
MMSTSLDAYFFLEEFADLPLCLMHDLMHRHMFLLGENPKHLVERRQHYICVASFLYVSFFMVYLVMLHCR